jgi:hypothetical protein
MLLSVIEALAIQNESLWQMAFKRTMLESFPRIIVKEDKDVPMPDALATGSSGSPLTCPRCGWPVRVPEVPGEEVEEKKGS